LTEGAGLAPCRMKPGWKWIPCRTSGVFFACKGNIFLDQDASRGAGEAAFIQRANGDNDVMVVAGWNDGDFKDDSAFFNMQSMLWRAGPSIGVEIENLSAVQKDGTVILNGGHFGGSVFFEGILEYDRVNDEWIRHASELINPRCVHTSVLVPDGYFDCQ